MHEIYDNLWIINRNVNDVWIDYIVWTNEWCEYMSINREMKKGISN